METVYVPLKFKEKDEFPKLQFYELKGIQYKFNDEGKKVLFIGDVLTKDAMYSGCCVSSYAESVFTNFITLLKYYAPNLSEAFLIPQVYASLKGMSEGAKQKIYTKFNEKLDKIISKYNPDLVVLMGTKFYKDEWYGIGQTKIIDGITYIKSLSLYDITDSVKQHQDQAYLWGYPMKQVACFLAGIKYKYPKDDEIEKIFVDTDEKIEQFFEALNNAETPCIDTETRNLCRVANTLLSIQVMTDDKRVWFIPYKHEDTPFNAKQLQRINKGFKDWAERGKCKYTIYHNAKFDLEQLKAISGYQWYNNLIYDTIAGMFCTEENRKILTSCGITKPFSLGQLALEYNNLSYHSGDIKKDDRGNMESFTLQQIMEYGIKDVIVPYYVARFQQQEALVLHNDRFFDCVTKQLGRMIYVMSEMEFRGVYVDKKHLLNQMSKNSIFNTVLTDVNNSLKNSENAREANLLKLKELGLPTGGGLFGGEPSWVLDINKEFDKNALFFEVMKLPVLEMNAKGFGKTDKSFQTTYKDVPEVKVLAEYRKVNKLKSAYINATYKRFQEDLDLQKDGRLRCSYGFQGVVTGRASSNSPNMQQIPAHAKDDNSKKMVGAIRRQFISTPSPHCYIQFHADYSAQEVRDWGNVAGDAMVSAPFRHSLDLSRQIRILDYEGKETEDLLKTFELEGDVHKLNYKFFYGRWPTTPEERQSVKQVVFGVIYGKGPKALAEDIKGTVEQAKNLIKTMSEKFSVGWKWIQHVQSFGAKTCIGKYPNGRIRHLWGYLFDDESVRASMNRKGPNSIIQGHASDINFIGGYNLKKYTWKFFGSKGINLGIGHNNVVHDSIEAECPLANLPIALYLVEHCYTTLVHTYMRKVWDFQFLADLVMEFDIGWTGADADKWDFTKKNYYDLVNKALEGKSKDLGQGYTKRQWKMMEHNFKVIQECRYEEMKASLKDEVASEHFFLKKYLDRLKPYNIDEEEGITEENEILI